MPKPQSEPDSWQQSLDRIRRAPHPPDSSGQQYQLPWNDPEFSRRMLEAHLDPSSDMASRRPQIIIRHVDWLEKQLMERGLVPANCHILDIGCGPGLYLHELARKGFSTTGFDFAPAALTWARQEAESKQLSCRFLKMDLTHLPADLPRQVGTVDAMTFWFGEFHSFSQEQAAEFLPRLAACLKPGGFLFLEYQPLDLFVQEESNQWSWVDSSPLCPRPHLWLEEFGWDESRNVEVHVHWILERDSGKLTRYVQHHHGWSAEELTALLEDAGLGEIEFYPPITGSSEEFEFPLLVARRTRDRGKSE